MQRNFLYTSLSLVILLIIHYSLLVSQSYANELSLGLYPSVITITAKAGKDIKTPLEIENFSDSSVTLRIKLQEFTGSDKKNGEVSFQKNSQEFEDFSQNISLLSDSQSIERITLAAKQKKQLTLAITIPGNQEAGDYTFSVLFISSDTSQNISEDPVTKSMIQGGIGVNILLTIGDGDEKQAIIQEFSTPKFIQSGPIRLSLLIQNPGKHLTTVSGTIIMKNAFNQSVGKMILPKAAILKNSSRYLLHDAIPWNNSWLLGPYQVTLHLVLANSNQEYTKSIYFFALPYNFIISIIILLILILIIKKRVNRYLSSH